MPPQRSRAASADAVRRAFARALPQPLAELREASEGAVEAATRASERLSQQLMTIAESTAAIEARIDAERAEREASNQDNFARRVSLLIEALNSASIDISKTFSHEVTDSAWAAYLKGDRGVFTRRAVRLLDAGEAREIARLHQERRRVPRARQPLHPRFRGDAAPDPDPARRIAAGRDVAVVGHGQAVRRAGAGDRAAAGLIRLVQS